MLATICDNCGVCHNGAACLPIDAAIILSRGCSLLAVLLAPLLVALGALLSVLDDNTG
jgi:hypothetical protein